jgi:acetolactate synthase-1/2/3 large subunit
VSTNVIIAAQTANSLYDLGIRRVYGLPGEDHMALLDSFAEAGLEYCAAFTESAAAIMAATEAQLSGLPGVVILSLAPGVSNGINGLLNTYLDEIPMILISGQHPADSLPFVVRQGFDIAQMVTPMTKWRARLTPGMNVPAVVGRAVDEAMSGRPGPVYLELPDGVATSESTADDASAAQATARLRARWVDGAPAPAAADPATVDAIAARLAAARHPVLVVGGRKRRLTPDTLAAFTTSYRIPVFTSSRQKGLLDSSSDFFAGTYLNGRLEKDLLDSADLVLMVDPESFDFYNKGWNFGVDAVAITDAAFTEWMNPFAATHVADPAALLGSLVARADRGGSVWTPADVRAYRDGLRAKLLPATEAFSVAHAVDAALSSWPTEGYLVADAGFGKPLVAMLSEPELPEHYFASNALSTMGYTIPTTVALRRSGRGPVLSFLGDGSLLMRAPEIAVSTGDGPGTVYLAIMDRALTQIEVKQERRKLATVGVTLPLISCAKLGDALGVEGIDVTSADELSAAVAKGLQGERPVLIGAYVDPAPSRVLFDLLRG